MKNNNVFVNNDSVRNFSHMFKEKPVVLSEAEADRNISKMFEEFSRIAALDENVAVSENRENFYDLASDYSFISSRYMNSALRGVDASEYFSGGLSYNSDEEKTNLAERFLQKGRLLDSLIRRYQDNSNNGIAASPRKLYRYIKVPDSMEPEDFVAGLVFSGGENTENNDGGSGIDNKMVSRTI